MMTQAWLRDAFHIATRDDLVAWSRDVFGGAGPRAYPMAQIVAVMGSAVCAQIVSYDDAWQAILLAGKLAQDAYGSWDDFATAYARADTAPLQQLRDGLWAELPWHTELGVTVFAPGATRVLQVTCPTCSAPRTRPSTSAYVYCDCCGQLEDFDVSLALAQPLVQPGPIYERLLAQVAPELAAARDRGDVDAYRAVQRRLFDAWIDACPHSLPVRIKDPAYRIAYVAWLADARVIGDFDAEARAHDATMRAAIALLQFVSIDGKIRVSPEPFAAMAAAYFAFEARCDALYVARELYAQHPEHITRELQRRIGFSIFVQGWLAMLDEAAGATLLERTGLARDYANLPIAATREAPCTHCGGPLALVEGARRVVCDHCGRLVDVVG